MSIAEKFTEHSIRPNIKIPYSDAERIIEAIALFGILFGIWTLLSNWSLVPDTIPQHFNAIGKPDVWGDKNTLFIIPSITVVLYAGLTILSRFPHIYNYPWKITEQNAETQYRLARLLIIWLKVVVVWDFSFILSKTIQVTLDKAESLGTAFLPITLILVFLPIVVYLVKAYKAR